MIVTLGTPSLRPEAGGPAYSVAAIGRNLRKRGVTTRFTVGRGRESVRPESVCSLLPFRDTDVVHNFGLWTAVNHWVSLSTRLARRPLVISPMGMLDPWSVAHHGLRKRAAMFAYQRRDLDAAAVIHVTASQEAGSVRKLGFRPPIALIPHGVDMPSSDNIQGAVTKDGRRKVLFLSRLHQVKGLLDLIDAWSVLRPKEWQVIVAGPDEGNYRAVLESAVSRHGLDKDISFAGPAYGEDKEILMRSSDLFVLPTHSENFGLVVPEALARGLPVLTTTAAPWGELLETRSGLWIEPGTESLIEGLRTALALSPEELQAMGARGQTMVRERYGWDAIIEKHIELYAWLSQGGTRPSFVS